MIQEQACIAAYAVSAERIAMVTAPPSLNRRSTPPRILSVLVLFCALSVTSLSHAQIVRDGSIGPPGGPLTGPNYQIDSTLGAIKGPNLFQSFSQFNLNTINTPGGSTVETATFTNSQPVAIGNVISRVTGGQPSSINGGIISQIPGANFYFVNPSGVVFGRNASLNTSGSFYVSTANYLRFVDGARFYASLSPASTLSSTPVAAFGFLGPTAAPITITQSRLSVPAGQTLSVIGGDISMTGDAFFTGFLGIPTLGAAGGMIVLASVASAGEVTLSPPGTPFNISLDGFTQLGQITLVKDALIDTSSVNGNGTVTIRGGRVLVDNKSFIFSDVKGNVNGAPLGIDLDITQDLVVSGGGRITSETDFNAAGSAGDVRIRAGSVQVTGFAVVDGQVRASLIGSRLFPGSTGKGATVDIQTGSLLVTNGGRIDTTTAGSGPPGTILVKTGSLQITSGGQIATSTEGNGQGGILQITASGDVTINGSGSGLFSQSTGQFVFNGVPGPGGSIALQAPLIQLQDGGTISATSISTGNAGNIRITAPDSLLLAGSSITTEAQQAFGGNIDLIVGNLLNLLNSQITTSVKSGVGNGGNITIDPQFVVLNQSQIIAQADAGNGGNINITAGVFLASPDSVVNASSNKGVNGSVNIQAPVQNLSGTLAPLQQAYLSAAGLLRQPCAARMQSVTSSSFILRGRDGLPAAPGGVLPSPPTPLPPVGGVSTSGRFDVRGAMFADSSWKGARQGNERMESVGACGP